MPSSNIITLKCLKCPLASSFYFSTCDHCSIYTSPSRTAACCFLTVSSFLSSSPLLLAAIFSLILSYLHLCLPFVFSSHRRSFCPAKPIFHNCRPVLLPAFFLWFFTPLTLFPLMFLPPNISLSISLSPSSQILTQTIHLLALLRKYVVLS